MTDKSSEPPGAALSLKPDTTGIARAADLLRAGKLVAFPTETVYGLGADATNGLAVAAIFDAKGRPRFNPLIVHVSSADAAEALAIMTPLGRKLAAAFWPGPLTLVLRRQPESPLSDLVSAGLDTVALRVPDHPVARNLLAAAGLPLAAPSANRSGHVSATTAEHVVADLGTLIGAVLDAGPTAHGIESTVVDASGDAPVLLRSGATVTETIESVLGCNVVRSLDGGSAPRSPGQLESHYAPSAKLRMNAREIRPGEALLAFGGEPLPTTGPALNLSSSGSLIEAAANLFAAMRTLDAMNPSGIAVMAIPDEGLGEAINDRLKRAAAG